MPAGYEGENIHLGMSMLLLGNTHTHSTFSDGRARPEDMIKRYKKLGYGFIIMTDHSKAEAPYECPKIDGIIVIEGCEVSSGEHYIYARAGKEEIRIKCHPGRYNDPLEEVEKWNLYEVTEHARLQKKYFECKTGHPVFSDDAHDIAYVGRAGIIVKAVDTPEDILKSINLGKFRLYASELII